MPELLLELLSEEIPARMQARAAENLRRLVTERLTGAGLAFKDARAYVTPRRLALVVTGLPAKQPDTQEEKKGPRLDAPAKAIEGFLRGHNLRSLDEAEVRETAKGSFYFLVRKRKGQAAAKVLPEPAKGSKTTRPSGGRNVSMSRSTSISGNRAGWLSRPSSADLRMSLHTLIEF